MTSNIDNPQAGIIILGVHIHCEGCADEVRRYLRGFEGVEGIEIDGKNNKVSVRGEKADPIKVTERLRKKSGKHIELISPNPPKQEYQNKKELDKKPPPAQKEVIEVVLKIYLHCESCAKEVKYCILKMEGVERVDPNTEKNLVCVKGSMNAEKLVEFINKRGGRHAQIVKQSNCCVSLVKSNLNNKKLDAPAPSASMHHQHQLVYAPQLFSDENPNSCSSM